MTETTAQYPLAREILLARDTVLGRAVGRKRLAHDGKGHRSRGQKHEHNHREHNGKRTWGRKSRVKGVIGEKPDGVKQYGSPHTVRRPPDGRQEKRANVHARNALQELLFAGNFLISELTCHDDAHLSLLRRFRNNGIAMCSICLGARAFKKCAHRLQAAKIKGARF